ncbi:MAG: ferritin family protein [Candidatus Erginobacter occultus]|nr:ferritin family protein [Candidatus Erginobacter occultus]
MSTIFNMAEVVDIGIEKEKARRDFYRAAAEASPEGEAKELFRKLAGWEEDHVRKFEEIRAELDEKEPPESYPGEEVKYIQALVADQLYRDTTAEKIAAEATSARAAITRGIEFEKDAILFFRSLGLFLSPDRREIIERLVGEEKDHLVYLLELRKSYLE